MSRTTKRSYTGSKAVDGSCRGHGSCPWCKRAREYKVKKRITLQEPLESVEAPVVFTEAVEPVLPLL